MIEEKFSPMNIGLFDADGTWEINAVDETKPDDFNDDLAIQTVVKEIANGCKLAAILLFVDGHSTEAGSLVTLRTSVDWDWVEKVFLPKCNCPPCDPELPKPQPHKDYCPLSI